MDAQIWDLLPNLRTLYILLGSPDARIPFMNDYPFKLDHVRAQRTLDKMLASIFKEVAQRRNKGKPALQCVVIEPQKQHEVGYWIEWHPSSLTDGTVEYNPVSKSFKRLVNDLTLNGWPVDGCYNAVFETHGFVHYYPEQGGRPVPPVW